MFIIAHVAIIHKTGFTYNNTNIYEMLRLILNDCEDVKKKTYETGYNVIEHRKPGGICSIRKGSRIVKARE